MSKSFINPVIIFGANLIGHIALDIFNRNGVTAYGFLDDDVKHHQILIDGVSVLGKTDDYSFLKLIGQKCDAFIAEDDMRVRMALVKMLQDERKTQPINAIHEQAKLSRTCSLGHGNLIDAGCVIAPVAVLGSHCNVFAQSYIGTSSVVGDFVQIGPGCVIGAEATIEDGAYIGAGATLVGGISIGANARIGAGAVVIASVKKGETVLGNPAKAVQV